jgi:hypothetical protein
MALHNPSRRINNRLDVTAPDNGVGVNDISQYLNVDDAKLLSTYCVGSRKARNIIDRIKEKLGEGNIKDNMTM